MLYIRAAKNGKLFCRMALRLSGLRLIDACRPDKGVHAAIHGGTVRDYLIPSRSYDRAHAVRDAADAGVSTEHRALTRFQFCQFLKESGGEVLPD